MDENRIKYNICFTLRFLRYFEMQPFSNTLKESYTRKNVASELCHTKQFYKSRDFYAILTTLLTFFKNLCNFTFDLFTLKWIKLGLKSIRPINFLNAKWRHIQVLWFQP